MPVSTDKTLVSRRDELIVAVQDILSPQLREQPLTVDQHIHLQKVIALYTSEILGSGEFNSTAETRV